MKKTVKVLSTLVLVSLFSVSLGSCSNNTVEEIDYSNKINSLLDQSDPQFLFGRDIKITYTKDINNDITELESEIDKIVSEGTEKYSVLSTKLDELNKFKKILYENRSYLSLNRYMYNNDEYIDLYQSCSSAYQDLRNYDINNTIEISKSSYRNDYFLNMTEKEIDDYIASLNPTADEAYAEYYETLLTLQNQVHKNEISTYEYFQQIIPAGKKVASSYGYDSYIDYLYKENYERDFSPDAVTKIYPLIKEYMVPVYDKMYNNYLTAYRNASSENRNKFIEMVTKFMGPYKKYFDDFSLLMGDYYNATYNDLWKSGNYFYSNVDDNPTTAYVSSFYGGTKYVFFSKNYQDIKHLSHEFGHYIAAFNSDNDTMDIKEIQSQGNEVLFAYYLNNYTDLDKELTDLYLAYTLYDLMDSIVNCYSVAIMENYVYSNNDLSYDDILSNYQKVNSDLHLTIFDSLDDSYFGNNTVNSPGYYISYSTSAVGAISFYSIILENGFETASECYKNIISTDKNNTYDEACAKAGILSAFNVNNYITFYNSMMKI